MTSYFFFLSICCYVLLRYIVERAQNKLVPVIAVINSRSINLSIFFSLITVNKTKLLVILGD